MAPGSPSVLTCGTNMGVIIIIIEGLSLLQTWGYAIINKQSKHNGTRLSISAHEANYFKI